MGSNLGIQQANEREDRFDLKEATAAIENTVSETVSELGESGESYKARIAEKLDGVKSSVSDNLADVAGRVHEKSDAAQDYLLEKAEKANSYARQTTEKVNDIAYQTIEKVNQAGHRAADALDASSGYVRNFDLAETRSQVVDSIKQRPEISIAVAGVFGLLIGLLIGRSSKG